MGTLLRSTVLFALFLKQTFLIKTRYRVKCCRVKRCSALDISTSIYNGLKNVCNILSVIDTANEVILFIFSSSRFSKHFFIARPM